MHIQYLTCREYIQTFVCLKCVCLQASAVSLMDKRDYLNKTVNLRFSRALLTTGLNNNNNKCFTTSEPDPKWNWLQEPNPTAKYSIFHLQALETPPVGNLQLLPDQLLKSSHWWLCFYTKQDYYGIICVKCVIYVNDTFELYQSNGYFLVALEEGRGISQSN